MGIAAKSLKKNDIVIVAIIFTIFLVATGNVFFKQRSLYNYFEDRLEKDQVAAVFKAILNDITACEKTLRGIKINPNESSKVTTLKSNEGGNIYISNMVFNHLQIGQIKVKSSKLLKESSSGLVDINVPVSRVRLGGGPREFKDLEFRVGIAVDEELKIISCLNSIKN